MKFQKIMFVIVMFTLITLIIVSVSTADKIKQGDKVTIITPGTLARLCPHANCGSNQHITRIPEGTVLKIEGIIDVKSGYMSVKWFEVTYKNKRGWISIFDTDKQ